MSEILGSDLTAASRILTAQSSDEAALRVAQFRDEIASPLRTRIAELEGKWATVLAVLGNVDHSKGGGANSAALYGGMLESIRDIATATLNGEKIDG